MTLSSTRADRVYFNLGMLSIDRCNLEFGSVCVILLFFFLTLTVPWKPNFFTSKSSTTRFTTTDRFSMETSTLTIWELLMQLE